MKTSIIAITIIAVTGCAVGPDYIAPQSEVPARWSAQIAGGENVAKAELVDWWKRFNDSELDSLISRALAANLDLKIAESRVREARASRTITASGFWPSINTSSSYARDRFSSDLPLLGDMAPPNTDWDSNVYQIGFDASWELDVFGGTRRKVEAADANVEAADYQRSDVRIILISEVARNYIEARSFQRRLEIANNNIKSQKEALALAQDRAKNGLGSDLDVQQAASLLAQTNAQVPSLEIGLQVSIHRLSGLLAQPPGAVLEELKEPQPLPSAALTVPVGLPSDLLRRRPDIRAAERNLVAANALIGAATADLFPKFSLTGNIGNISAGAGDIFTAGSRYWAIGPSISWQVFDAGRVRARIEVQNARHDQAFALYQKAVLRSLEEVENSLVQYAKEQERRNSLEVARQADAENLRLSNELYSKGLASFINVIDAQRSLYQIEDGLAQSDTLVTQNLIALYKALGGGWEESTNERG